MMTEDLTQTDGSVPEATQRKEVGCGYRQKRCCTWRRKRSIQQHVTLYARTSTDSARFYRRYGVPGIHIGERHALRTGTKCLKVSMGERHDF